MFVRVLESIYCMCSFCAYKVYSPYMFKYKIYIPVYKRLIKDHIASSPIRLKEHYCILVSAFSICSLSLTMNCSKWAIVRVVPCSSVYSCRSNSDEVIQICQLIFQQEWKVDVTSNHLLYVYTTEMSKTFKFPNEWNLGRHHFRSSSNFSNSKKAARGQRFAEWAAGVDLVWNRRWEPTCGHCKMFDPKHQKSCNFARHFVSFFLCFSSNLKELTHLEHHVLIKSGWFLSMLGVYSCTAGNTPESESPEWDREKWLSFESV